MPARLSRATYADMYGPTTGDRVRLADTELFIEVEKDFTTYGEEVKFGGGKVIRDGMGQSQATRAEGAVDTVITNALIVDVTGIYKADVGLKNGRIAADRQGRQSRHPAGRHHHHRPLDRDHRRRRQDPHRRRHGRATSTSSRPQQIEEALMSGVTTMLGGGTGPAHGTLATTCTGAWHIMTHDERVRGLPDEPRARRQGQCLAPRPARGDDPRRRLLAEAARGLGHDARRRSTTASRSPTPTTCR